MDLMIHSTHSAIQFSDDFLTKLDLRQVINEKVPFYYCFDKMQHFFVKFK